MPRAIANACWTSLALCLGGGPCSDVAAQSSFLPDTAIQHLLDERVRQGRAVGLVLVTYQRGGVPRSFHAGRTGRAGLPLGDDVLFEIGSVTKTFTATLLADMVRRGEVALDDPVTKHLPPDVKVPTRAGRPITLVDLATHTSGLPGLPTNIAPGNIKNPYADYSVRMLDEFLAAYQLPRDIGVQYEYSAVGLGLLGRARATDWERRGRPRSSSACSRPSGWRAPACASTRACEHALPSATMILPRRLPTGTFPPFLPWARSGPPPRIWRDISQPTWTPPHDLSAERWRWRTTRVP